MSFSIKNGIKINIIIVFTILLIVPFIVHGAVYKVTPLVIDEELKQRDIVTKTIKIENNANYKVSIFPTVNEITKSAGDVTEFVPASVSDGKLSVTSWIEVTRAVLELAPGEVREIPLTIRIHPQASAGEYHALIGFGTGRNRDDAERQVRAGNAPGVVLRIAVDKNKTEFLKLGQFSIDRFVVNKDNQAVHYKLANPGSSVVIPEGEIIIYNTKGVEIEAIDVNPEKTPLAPGQVTEYSSQIPTDGLFGRYKAMLTVDYGTSQRASVYGTEFFYALPWQKLAIVGIVLLLICIAIVVYLHRKYNFDMEEQDINHISLIKRETISLAKDHDINLKKNE